MWKGAGGFAVYSEPQDAGIIEHITSHGVRRRAAKILNDVKKLTSVGVKLTIGAALDQAPKAIAAGMTEAYAGRESTDIPNQKVAALKTSSMPNSVPSARDAHSQKRRLLSVVTRAICNVLRR